MVTFFSIFSILYVCVCVFYRWITYVSSAMSRTKGDLRQPRPARMFHLKMHAHMSHRKLRSVSQSVRQKVTSMCNCEVIPPVICMTVKYNCGFKVSVYAIFISWNQRERLTQEITDHTWKLQSLPRFDREYRQAVRP